MKTIAVFFGGNSTEHDVSCITGVLTTNGIDKSKYKVIPVYIARTGEWYTGKTLNDVSLLKKPNVKTLDRVAFIGGDNALYRLKKGKVKKIDNVSAGVVCLHGVNGEDGALRGYLNMCGVAVVGADLAPSSVAMDKIYTKLVLKALGIKTLPYAIYDDDIPIENFEEKLGYPIIVKPVSQGSSIGVNKATDRKELIKSINKAKKFDDKILLEKCAEDFYEINCAVYSDEHGVNVSACEMPKTNNNFLTFEDKYLGGERLFPAPISEKISSKIQSIAKKIYTDMYFSGVIRVDFIVSGEVFVNEINSVPGSMAYYLFADTLTGLSEMLDELIERR